METVDIRREKNEENIASFNFGGLSSLYHGFFRAGRSDLYPDSRLVS
jgi:hypothetical protein